MKKTPFTYEVELENEDGGTEKVTFTLKPASQLPVGIARKNRGSQEAQMWASFEWALSEDQLDQFDRLTIEQMTELSTAWQEASEEADQDKPVGRPKTKTDPDAE